MDATCNIPNCRNRAPDAEPFCAEHRKRLPAPELPPLVTELLAICRQAASDFHLISLHGEMRPMWEDAKAGRDRVLAALESLPA